MAGKKGKVGKKQNMTLEERLAEALVPVEEQPYEVPENWVWTFLTIGFADCLDQFRKPINASERALRLGNIPYYGATGQVGWIDDFLTNEQLVLVGEDGAPFLDSIKNKAYIIMGKAWVNNHAHILRSFYGEIGNHYLCYYLNSFNYKSYVNGTTRLKLTQQSLNTIPIPIAPLLEQQRIVAQIESLFLKLDRARDLVQSALDSFETRKAAILHRAFTGELTADWRTENNLEIDSWKETTLDKCGTLERGRSKHRPRNAPELFNGPYPFIQTGDVAAANVYVTSHKQTLSDIGLQQSRLFPKGTLCITIAANIGDVAILSYDSCFPDSVVGFTPKDEINPKFIYYMMKVLQKKLESEAPATAQKNINLKVLSAVGIKCPILPEQQEIVRILDNLLESEQKAKGLCDILDKIDLMKKSILARAFRGELGTNDPTEESAMELLNEVLQSQDQLQ